MGEETLFIESRDGNKLACLVAKPEGRAAGLVISSQGFGSTKNKPSYQHLLTELSKTGFIVILFEYQGLGESEGKFEEKTETRDLEDLKAVVEYAYNSFDFDKDNFFIFGSSFGGFTALNLALDDKRIKGLVLKAPVSDFEPTCRYIQNKGKYILNYESFLEDGKKYDIYSKASELEIPVKIIHGDKDTTVPIEQSKKLINLLSNAEIKIIEGEGHSFENKKEELYSQIIKFFEALR